MSMTQSYSNASAVVSIAGVNVPATVQVDVLGNVVSAGGSSTVSIAEGTVANTVVKASAGRLCRVLITATGAGSVAIYDNASTASGTYIGITPANPAAGTTYDFEMPAVHGITVAGGSTVPGITVSFY